MVWFLYMCVYMCVCVRVSEIIFHYWLLQDIWKKTIYIILAKNAIFEKRDYINFIQQSILIIEYKQSPWVFTENKQSHGNE